jgi:hypothetical protein
MGFWANSFTRLDISFEDQLWPLFGMSLLLYVSLGAVVEFFLAFLAIPARWTVPFVSVPTHFRSTRAAEFIGHLVTSCRKAHNIRHGQVNIFSYQFQG